MKHNAAFIEIDVRDYECDIGGIVNNSVYFNYLEHARHLYLKALGIDFAQYARDGVNLVVVRSEADYKYPLVSGDRCVVRTSMERISRGRFQFNQQIFRAVDEKLVLDAKIIGTAINARGRPAIPEEIDKILPFVSAKQS